MFMFAVNEFKTYSSRIAGMSADTPGQVIARSFAVLLLS